MMKELGLGVDDYRAEEKQSVVASRKKTNRKMKICFYSKCSEEDGSMCYSHPLELGLFSISSAMASLWKMQEGSTT